MLTIARSQTPSVIPPPLPFVSPGHVELVPESWLACGGPSGTKPSQAIRSASVAGGVARREKARNAAPLLSFVQSAHADSVTGALVVFCTIANRAGCGVI